MGSHGQGFWHVFTALRTVLASVSRADFDYDFDGACSLKLQNLEELSPTDIGNMPCQVVVFEHIGDAEFLYANHIETFYQRSSDLMMKVFSGIGDFLMGFGKQNFGFLPTLRLPGKQPAFLVSSAS